MKPIWYFVGLILSVIGFIILLTGIYLVISPSPSKPVLGELHPDIWWGAIMVVVGVVFILKNRNVRIE
jgi:uncharacterized membrane protein